VQAPYRAEHRGLTVVGGPEHGETKLTGGVWKWRVTSELQLRILSRRGHRQPQVFAHIDSLVPLPKWLPVVLLSPTITPLLPASPAATPRQFAWYSSHRLLPTLQT
jgi:hypothetical protein